MKWTGLSQDQIRREMDKLPRYTWKLLRDKETGEFFQIRTQAS